MIQPVPDRRSFALLSSASSRRRGVVIARFSELGRPDGPAHVAFALSKRVGGAVVRNRIRRRLRAVMAGLDRTNALRGGLYLLSAGAAAATAPFLRLDHDVRLALADLGALR